MCRFLPAPSVRRATVNHFSDFLRQMISIHALREEGDLSPATGLKRVDNFYPRPPRGGRRSMASRSFGSTLFLSTPSARRATAEQLRQPMGGMISIHALREEGDTGKLYTFLAYEISIHALREEGDTRTRESARSTKNFYPRPPRGGRRIYIELDGSPKFISIHALREEGDISDTETPIPPRYFYPRPPRGGRRMTTTGRYWQTSVFLSTPSARRATSSSLSGWMWKLFLSTPSARRATFCQLLFGALHPISIHALREEGDLKGAG